MACSRLPACSWICVNYHLHNVMRCTTNFHVCRKMVESFVAQYPAMVKQIAKSFVLDQASEAPAMHRSPTHNGQPNWHQWLSAIGARWHFGLPLRCMPSPPCHAMHCPQMQPVPSGPQGPSGLVHQQGSNLYLRLYMRQSILT